MNHLNCFVLSAMAKAMQTCFEGLALLDAYSNSQEHLLLDFGKETFSCVFYRSEVFFDFGQAAEAKSRLYKPQFSELHGLTLLRVKAHRFERSFVLEFQDQYSLLFVCHGRKSNVVLFQGEQNLDLFRRMHAADAGLQLSDFKDRAVDFSLFPDEAALRAGCPFLPEEFFADSAAGTGETLKRFESMDGFDISPDGKGLVPVFGRNTVLRDISHFTHKHLREIRFADTLRELLEATEKSISEKESFLHSNAAALKTIKAKRSDEELGNILLAGMHLIQPGSSVAVLPDIYRGTDITIKLDPKLKPVENAERYFKKAKGLPHAIRQLEDKIAQAEKALHSLREKLKTLNTAASFKDLKPFVKQKDNKAIREDLPYRRFEYQGYEILVGKHAESNEKLLNYYSDKDDVWLHAKDVSGSHVLIKTGRKASLPEAVMEAAAALAGYYSKNRKQNLVTVAWTLRKYVRKIKGAEKGKVSVSNEKSLLVKPGLPA